MNMLFTRFIGLIAAPAGRLRLPVYLTGLIVAVSAQATTVIPPTFGELVNESDYIVRGVVKAVTSEWREQGGHRNIFTKVEVEIVEVINGTPPQPLVLEMLGGRMGEVEMVVSGMPVFQVGQEDILFVRGNGRQFYPLTAAMHGRYPIRRDQRSRAIYNRSNRVPLQATAEVTLPLAEEGSAGEMQQRMSSTASALTPVQFVQQIRAAVAAKHAPAARAD